MSRIFTLDQIKSACRDLDFGEAIEEGFAAYSRGEVVVPPVGEMSFENPPGDTHIKFGYIKNDDVFVIKIASGFYDNPKMGLPSNSGLMLVFSQKTGVLKAVLLDEGYLTDIRTAVAGQVAARYLAPSEVSSIGVLGTGIQARLQVEFLKRVIPCRSLVVWGRSETSLSAYRNDMVEAGFDVEVTMKAEEVAARCNLIITATPSNAPLLMAADIRPGTHITAMGSDTRSKQELDSKILGMADIVVADSRSQCIERGEIAQALKQGELKSEKVVELGQIISSGEGRRTDDMQISVADLTGVAVQDIQIAKAVCRELMRKTSI